MSTYGQKATHKTGHKNYNKKMLSTSIKNKFYYKKTMLISKQKKISMVFLCSHKSPTQNLLYSFSSLKPLKRKNNALANTTKQWSWFDVLAIQCGAITWERMKHLISSSFPFPVLIFWRFLLPFTYPMP